MTIGAAIVIPAAIAVGVLIPHDSANQVELEQIVDRFRDSTVPIGDTEPAVAEPSAPASDASTSIVASAGPLATASTTQPSTPLPTLVEPGVYVYRTTGFEHIDALSGHTHEYPAETTITVTPEGCGMLLRWDALEERREEWRLCATADGVALQTRGLQYHEFFDQETPEDQLCDVPVLLVPLAEGSHEAVAQTCTLAGKPWLPIWEILEADIREVSGEPIEVRHVRMTIDDNDEHFEHYVADWMLAPSGLPVELTVLKQSKSPSIVGDVVYDEEIRLELVSFEPLR